MRHFIAILFLLGAVVTKAQEAPPLDTTKLEEIVVEDSRLFDKETAGAKHTRIDSLVLEQKLNNTLSELLAENTSVFIKSYGRGSLATASFRGTAPSHTQVLWNGMNLNSPMLGMVDFSLFPVYFIDDVSLKHGGASTEDISGALGGTVNIDNNKRPDWGNKLSGRAVQGVGSYTTLEEFAQVNIGNAKWQSKTRGYYTYSKNDFPFVNDAIIGSPRVRNVHGEYKIYSAMQELYRKINGHNTLYFNAWLHHADRGIPRLQSYEGADDANVSTQLDESLRLHGSWEHHYRKGTIHTGVGTNLQSLDYFLRHNINGLGLQSSVYSQSKIRSLFSRMQVNHDLSARSSLKFTVNANRHTVQTYDSVAKTGYDTHRNEMLLYGAYHHNFRDRLNIRASLREDYIGRNFIPIIPYVGFDFRVFKARPLFLKGSVTRNYHVPTLNDLYWQPGGNPNLLPEKGVYNEMSLAGEKHGTRAALQWEVTGFYADITNWILWVPNFKGYWEPHNVKRVVTKGVEVVAKLNYTLGKVHVLVNANYIFNRALNYGDTKTWGDDSYGKQLVYTPVHSGNLFFNARYKEYGFTWQHYTYSRRFTTSSNDLTERQGLPTNFLNQAYLSREFKAGKLTFDAQLKVYNLFNEYYRSVLGRRMPGRNYMLLITMRF